MGGGAEAAGGSAEEEDAGVGGDECGEGEMGSPVVGEDLGGPEGAAVGEEEGVEDGMSSSAAESRGDAGEASKYGGAETEGAASSGEAVDSVVAVAPDDVGAGAPDAGE